MSLFAGVVSQAIDAARTQIADELTVSLQVMLKNNGIPVQDYRVISVTKDFNISYPRKHAARIERWEHGMGTDLEPKALLRKFDNRMLKYINAMAGGKAT